MSAGKTSGILGIDCGNSVAVSSVKFGYSFINTFASRTSDEAILFLFSKSLLARLNISSDCCSAFNEIIPLL